jgi:hypothetical protein
MIPWAPDCGTLNKFVLTSEMEDVELPAHDHATVPYSVPFETNSPPHNLYNHQLFLHYNYSSFSASQVATLHDDFRS